MHFMKIRQNVPQLPLGGRTEQQGTAHCLQHIAVAFFLLLVFLLFYELQIFGHIYEIKPAAVVEDSQSFLSSGGVNDRWVFVITPTKSQTIRDADITRMAQSLAGVPRLKWVVVEDGPDIDASVFEILKRKRKQFGLDFVYLAAPTDSRDRCRGSTQRNAGLQWVLDRVWPASDSTPNPRVEWVVSSELTSPTLNPYNSTGGVIVTKHTKIFDPAARRLVMAEKDVPGWEPHTNTGSLKRDGQIYFADDDNTYDSDLFSEIRQTTSIGLFPVGLVTATSLSSPIVHTSSGEIIGFYDGWIAQRMWPVDMAGFAVSLSYMLKKNADRSHWFFPLCNQGGQSETNWLLRFGIPEDNTLEPLSHKATRVFVWHTQTRKSGLGTKISPPLKTGTNLEILAESTLIRQSTRDKESGDKK